MNDKDITQSVRLSKEYVKFIKRYITEEGGTIRSVLEEAILLKIPAKYRQKNKS